MGKMKKDKRFTTITEEGGLGGAIKVIQDKETGVSYLLYSTGYGVAITPLLDQAGKPAVTATSQYNIE